MSSLFKRLALPVIVLLWSASYFIEVLGYSKKNQYLIKPVFIAMVILFLINTVTDVLEWKKEQRQIQGAEKGDVRRPSVMEAEEKRTLLRSLLVVLSMAAYIIVMPYLGFVISTVALVVFLLALMQVRQPLPMILLPLILTGILFAAFKIGLHIPLPAGFLGF